VCGGEGGGRGGRGGLDEHVSMKEGECVLCMLRGRVRVVYVETANIYNM
jgi:hypothetical protein